MTKSSCFHNFYKEIGRFSARDEKGKHHTVVERMKINQTISMNGKLISSNIGLPQFYSATTGDILVKRADGNLVDQNNTYCIVSNFSEIGSKLIS
ncbi:MAG: hypothetical protein EOP12_03030 [Pseudomonas sp.]|nr:MAG: hypothetical protein EOP12_03030 [Pseudomonas sp.]